MKKSANLSALGGAVVCVTLSLFVPLAAQETADATRNVREKSLGRKQIKQAKKWLARDQEELKNFQQLISQFDTAHEAGDPEALKAAYSKVGAAMKSELEQVKAKAEQYKKELRQSRREVRGERREVSDDRDRKDDNEDHAEADLVGDTLNLGDDRRDRRDDRNDLKALGARAKQMGEIATQFTSTMPGQANGTALPVEKQRQLLVQFQEIMQAEIEDTERELKEDMKELKEDRRETRQGRRRRWRDRD
jgi:hypothetical protein